MMRRLQDVSDVSRPPEATTGPEVLMSVIARHLAENTSTKRNMIIYPPHLFNPISWLSKNHPQCLHFNGMNSRQLAECRKSVADKAYVIQYHTQVWSGGRGNINRNDI